MCEYYSPRNKVERSGIWVWEYLHNMVAQKLERSAVLDDQNDSVSVKKQETLKCSFNFLLI